MPRRPEEWPSAPDAPDASMQIVESAPNVLGIKKDKTELARGIARLINCESLENESDTPDWILGEYLADCLDAFTLGVAEGAKGGDAPGTCNQYCQLAYEKALRVRDNWYGKNKASEDEEAEDEPDH